MDYSFHWISQHYDGLRAICWRKNEIREADFAGRDAEL